MTLASKHVDREFLKGGYEILLKWIAIDLISGKSVDEIHDFYKDYSFGKNNVILTEEEFFLAYRSAQLVCKDRIEFVENKKTRIMFRRTEEK